MSFLDSISDTVRRKFAESSARKKEEQDMLRKLRIEANETERVQFEKSFRENAKIMAIAKAKKDAAKASGIQKMRAQNRLRNLESGKSPAGALSKFSEMTQRNLARTEERKKRVMELRKIAQEEKDKRLANAQALRKSRGL